MIDMVDVFTNASVNSRNGLLAALESSDFALLHAHLRKLSLIAGTILQEQEAPVEQIFSAERADLTRRRHGSG
jgi:hypothetical protein